MLITLRRTPPYGTAEEQLFEQQVQENLGKWQHDFSLCLIPCLYSRVLHAAAEHNGGRVCSLVSYT